MTRTKQPVIIFFCFLHFGLSAQDFNIFLHSDKTWNIADSNCLMLDVDNSNFFKNNEYMGEFKQGYTVPGYIFRPRLTYYAGDKTKITGGIHVVNLFGEVEFYEVRPVYSIQHAFTPELHLVLGELHGNLNHGLPDAIYDFDRYFFDHMEQGLQLLVFSDWLTADLWLDWEHFIFWGDPSQEEGTLGFSGEAHVLKGFKKWQVDIPLQGIICHRGGQINSSNMPNQSQTNLSSGVQITYHSQSFLNYISFRGQYIYFNDFSDNQTEVFIDGYGINPSLTLNTRIFEFQTAYWHAYKYYGPRGDPLYFSVSSYNNTIEPYRDMLINKIGISRHYEKGISAGLFFETFYDMHYTTLEYNYSIYLRFNQSFFLKKIQGRRK